MSPTYMFLSSSIISC